MSSIRQRLDGKFLSKCDVEYFNLNKGMVPLCCCLINYSNPITYKKNKEPLYKCDQMETRLPLSLFEPYCLKCQKYIEEKLKQGVKTID